MELVTVQDIMIIMEARHVERVKEQEKNITNQKKLPKPIKESRAFSYPGIEKSLKRIFVAGII